jgi:hypothetical protein
VTAPDLAEPLRGWRAWRVVETRAGLRLCSVIYDETWEPGKPFLAACQIAAGEHDAPNARCECGVYASRTSSHAARYLLGRNDPLVVHRVVGVVRLWGAVFEGSGGWRAEVAYPERLWVPQIPGADEIARLLRVYNVAVEAIGARSGPVIASEIASLA